MLIARRVAFIVLALGTFAACGGPPDDPGPPAAATSAPQNAGGPLREFEFSIHPLGDSGVNGEASLETLPGGEASRLLVSLDGADEGPLALHTHSGPCTPRATTPTHDLDPVVDGKVELEMGASVQGLTHGNFNLSIHESDDGDSPHIACGAISGPPADE
jgi:hypothetical protein